MKTPRSLIAFLSTAASISLLTFFALRLVPGDPVEMLIGEGASAVSKEALALQLGLKQPLLAQLWNYLNGLLHGDFGMSIAQHVSVRSLLSSHLGPTLLLAASASVFSNALGVPLGALAAARSWRWLQWLSTALSAVPAFWAGPLLILAFSLRWPWLPMSPAGANARALFGALALPTLTLGIALSAHVFQTTRAAVAETLGADYVRTAYAKGSSAWRVVFLHALPNALAPIVTTSLLQLGNLISGAVVTEAIFDWPGLGKLLVDAIAQRDYPVVQGVTLFSSLLYLGLNRLGDALLRKGPS